MSLADVTARGDAQEVLLLDEGTLDPKLTYRWVTNNPLAIAKRSTQGYVLVSRSKDKVKLLIENGRAPDDYYYNGDSVLMACSTDRVKVRRKRTSDIANSRLGSPVAEFKNEFQNSGARNSRVLVDEEGE